MAIGAILAGGAALGGLVSGVMGAQAQADAAKRAAGLTERGMRAFEDLNIPPELRLQLEELQAQGQLTPEMYESIVLGQSGLGGIEEDPRLRQAQIDALGQLQKVSGEGMTEADRAKLEMIRSEQMAQERGSRQAILQNMAARGMSGSGMELAAELQNAQGGADQRALAGAQQAIQSQNARMEAIKGMANLGGNIREADYSQKARAAEAQDAIARWNAQNQQSIMNQNVGMRNEAAAANLANAQRIAEANVGLRNQANLYNMGADQRRYENQLNRARGIAGQSGAAGSAAIAGGQAVGQALGGLSQAGLGAAGAIFSNYGKQKTGLQQDDDSNSWLYGQRQRGYGGYSPE